MNDPDGMASCARAGYSDGSTAFELPGSGVCGEFLEVLSATSLNSDVTGRFLFQARNGEIINDVEESTPVPEPGTLMLLGSGVVGAIVARRRAVKR